jgi:DNA-binding YbaB/EbfC family protein
MFDPRKMLDMLKNSADIQKNMQEKLKNEKASGEALGGMVKVLMNGHFEVESLILDEKLFSEDKKFIEDVIKAAFNDAAHQLRSNMADQLKNLLGGFAK